MTPTLEYGTYRLGTAYALTNQEIKHLANCFDTAARPAKGILSGRTETLTTNLEGPGPVVIKPYFRGGLIGHVNKRTYLGIGKPRSRAEFEMLEHVRSLGVYAPEPVAYAVRGRFFYRAWLVTLQIKDAISLSDLSLHDPDAAREVIPSAARQVEILVSNGIHHVDLHPGNVLVDAQGTAWFIDFDRAETGVKDKRRLRQRLIKRWIRAADKYCLPEFVRNAIGTSGPG